MALEAWRYLANGGGGIDWAGLPIVVELLGVGDVERLLRRLKLIKNYRSPKEEANHGTGNPEH